MRRNVNAAVAQSSCQALLHFTLMPAACSASPASSSELLAVLWLPVYSTVLIFMTTRIGNIYKLSTFPQVCVEISFVFYVLKRSTDYSFWFYE